MKRRASSTRICRRGPNSGILPHFPWLVVKSFRDDYSSQRKRGVFTDLASVELRTKAVRTDQRNFSRRWSNSINHLAGVLSPTIPHITEKLSRLVIPQSDSGGKILFFSFSTGKRPMIASSQYSPLKEFY